MSFENFYRTLKTSFPKERLLNDPVELLAHGTDASFYRLIPKLVVKAETEEHISQLLKEADKEHVSLTFRTAGTSLSGQAVSDSILVKLGHDWKGVKIEDEGKTIRLQPGVIGSRANHLLKSYSRKIGPDPASIDSAMIGGIAANNASGMCCGTAQNSYRTLKNMRLILADGTVLNSSEPSSCDEFRLKREDLLAGLTSIRQRIHADSKLLEMIKRKYKIKNTSGYGLNSFIDFEDPLDILLHLMIGSEGTLGFISEISYNTVEDPQFKSCSLVIFNDIGQACHATAALKTKPVSAVELMDESSLQSMSGRPGVPNEIPEGSMALLVDVRGSSQKQLDEQVLEVENCLQEFGGKGDFSNDQVAYDNLWKIRKGLFPIVGANRAQGTTVIIEDVCFPIEELAEGTVALQQLLKKHAYDEAVIFGHALEGNLHFVFTQSFNDEKEVQRYALFMDDLSELMVGRFHGSLKAEHGTGRNMAPFMEAEWGSKAYQLMKEIKELFDPKNILNPDVIISKNTHIHLENLKPIPPADELIDKCIECGFCEPVCPSKEFSLTPRQRIALWRRIQQLEQAKTLSDSEQNELKELKKNYQHLGIDSCAATGMCAQRCPVGINTGDLIRQLRSEKLGSTGKLIAKWSANHFAAVSASAATAFKINGLVAAALGDKTVDKIGVGLHNISGKRLPLWHAKWPTKARKTVKRSQSTSIETITPTGKPVIYFASCASRTMGPNASNKEQRSLTEVSAAVLEKAGFDIIYPSSVNQLCCGLPFHSKGAADIAKNKGNELITQLTALSNNGEIPIVFDTSPCNLRIKELGTQLKIYELTDFCAQFVIEHLTIVPKTTPVALHITCSSRKAGIADSLRKIAQICATEVIEPLGIECCGFAGDKGFTMPALNESALSPLKAQIFDPTTQGYSNSRTCEIGLSKNSGIDYQSLIYLLDEVSQ